MQKIERVRGGVEQLIKVRTALGYSPTMYWIAFTPARKPDRIRLIHTKRTVIISAISVTITEVNPAAPIS